MSHSSSTTTVAASLSTSRKIDVAGAAPKFVVFGGTGLLGSALVRRLTSSGRPNTLLAPSREKLDLMDSASVRQYLSSERADMVIVAAGRVGGILDNINNPYDLIIQNTVIQANIAQAMADLDDGRVMFFGSSCMYPKVIEQPMAESSIHSGTPEPTSMSYAVSKMSGMQLAIAYNAQFGRRRFMGVVPNSIYGPNDNFDPQNGHVVSALISKFHKAKQDSLARVTLWGSGKVRREFLYCDDVADAVINLADLDWDTDALDDDFFNEPVNIGAGFDYSIAELAGTIASVVGYEGEIDWDTSMPDGSLQKLLDGSKMIKMGWQPHTSLADGLAKTYEWYCERLASE